MSEAPEVRVGPTVEGVSPNTAGTANNLPRNGYTPPKKGGRLSKGPKRGPNGEFLPARYPLKSRFGQKPVICQDN